ncbi:MAG: CRISPR-associated endoribonuclease Cas6 [Ignavibacteriaceae bacterium]|nr:CRISPR-associated endoribonuclease Cas6 [Ignavibacteriaceae bacterium]
MGSSQPPLLTLNYQYPLSAAIYKAIQKVDHEFAAFLHDKGYGEGAKSFKLFTFSDIRTPFKIIGDRMQLLTGKATLIVCFHIPEAAENFIKWLFIHQQLEIADKKTKVIFSVEQVESVPSVLPAGSSTSDTSFATVIFQPLSPMVVGRKNDRGHYDYRSPFDIGYTDCLLYNWLEKYQAASSINVIRLEQMKERVQIRVEFFPHPPQQRLIAIKQGTEAETRIRGYTKFRLKVTAPAELLELASNAGLGLHNAQGMGCVEIIRIVKEKNSLYGTKDHQTGIIGV